MQTHHTRELAQTLQLALAAAEAGRAVFPLRGKVPAIPKEQGGSGVKDATRERSRVIGLFNKAQNPTGYGIATGAASKLIVVDIDGPEAQREADRLGLTSGYIVRTGREDGGLHLYFTIPPGVEVRSRDLAEGLELKADGHYVAGPGSIHPSGRPYRIERGGAPSPAPACLLAEPDRSDRGRAGSSTGPVSIDTAGPPILKSSPGRNKTLASIAGRLHDGTRSLGDLTRDLLAINEARCTPPLAAAEVRKIAESIHRREPCNPRPQVPESVLSKIEFLRSAAEARPVRGKGGGSGWSVCHAGLTLAGQYGKDHPRGFTLAVDRRTWALEAACNHTTVTRWIKRSPLVEVIDQGSGTRPATVLFLVPQIGGQLHHSSTQVVSQENTTPASGAVSTLFRTLYRSRWSAPTRKAKRGVAVGTRRVRENSTPGREGINRMGKSRASLLDLIRRNPNAARCDLARMKGVKPDSLKKPLRWLCEAGLIVRTDRGRYAAADALAQRLADVRVAGEEPQADRDQLDRHRRQREAYRDRHKIKAEPAPSPGETRERRESYPDRRRAHIEQAIAALFAALPDYRSRRVGQIVCKLPDYLPAEFPRGPDGLPKDHEVEAILDGVAA